VPYSQRPIMGFWSGLKGSKEARFGRAGKLWKVEDQRFVHDRPDVLSFVTEPLAEDLEIAGRIVAQLFASTSGTDSDWVVKLIDVYPESYPAKPEMGGYQLMIADDVLRGKFHESFEKPVALEPGKVTQFEIDLRTRNHLFRKGHRIMVQVQSSWFPLIDRNPQTFVDIPNARDRDYRRAEQRIYFAKDQASHIRLPIVNRD
jgi:putative CocE/NonD family hydrolase